MKRVYMVECGTESSTGTLDDPIQWEFDDLNEAVAFYDEIDLRCDWIREYNTSYGASRHNIMAKQIIGCIDFGGDIEYGRVFKFSEYGESEYRMGDEY